ncbi:MAG: hypothetical protein Q8L49_07445 [Burkholderiaceae bacterium]|nr:hypothetical protein [Burkholderiaceae bacterium]
MTGIERPELAAKVHLRRLCPPAVRLGEQNAPSVGEFAAAAGSNAAAGETRKTLSL